jgi:hypothetical protein
MQTRFQAALLGLITAAVLAEPATALAGPFVVRTSRATYADDEVARPVTIAKEWAEFSIGFAYRDVTKETDSDGNVQDAPYHYRLSWLQLSTRYGFTRNLTLFMEIPYAVGSQMESASVPSANTPAEIGSGDARFGFVWQVLAREKATSLTSLALQVDTKQPTGNEAPGGPGARHLLLGTGTTNAGIKMIGKQRLGPLALVADVGYVHRFSAVTMWVRDSETSGLNGRTPPPLLRAGHGILQAGGEDRRPPGSRRRGGLQPPRHRADRPHRQRAQPGGDAEADALRGHGG